VRIRYIIPVKSKIVIPDHWEFPVLGGVLRFVEERGLVKALEVVFANQSVQLAPTIQEHDSGQAKVSIQGRDSLLPAVRSVLEEATSFLECYSDIGLAVDEIEAKYEGESTEEEAQIRVKSMRIGNHEHASYLTFDMFTRAIMASQEKQGPKFEVALVSSARGALSSHRFIDSFRYSFLLIEFMYGGGQFKSASLKETFKKSAELRQLIERALAEKPIPRSAHASDTLDLLKSNPSVDALIDHLVDKRGFYFHGNIQRKDAWRPEQQQVAQVLSLITISIANSVAMQATASMFDEEFNKRHFEYARKVGAMVVFQIKYTFTIPGEKVQHDDQVSVRVPGTKVTPRMAFDIAQRFMKAFEHDLPTAGLEHADCTVQETGEKVFDIKFYVEKQG
jgi:hypothetical protein